MTIFSLDIFGITLAPTWYGFMYMLSFLIFLYFLKKNFVQKDVDFLFIYTFFWVIFGGRLWYILFYNLSYYLHSPVEILMPWKWGMSFHGWCIGVILAWFFASRKIKKDFLLLSDKLVWIVPVGLFFGRLGNFINKELLWWPGYSGPFAVQHYGNTYFPTPLLEALGEWVILFLLLFKKKRQINYRGQLGVWFLVGYGIIRFCVEFIRSPDAQIGYIFWYLTLWQILSSLMVIFGVLLSIYLKRGK